MRPQPPPIALEDARGRLRELGYLQGPVERFFFRRALERPGGVLLPVVLAGAVCAALASVAAVEAGDNALRGHALSAAVLGAHLAAANLVPCALLGWLLAARAGRSRSPGIEAAAAGLGAAGTVFLLFAAGVHSLAGRLSTEALLWGLPAGAAAFLLGVSVRSAFLARAYERSGDLPSHRRGRAAAIGLLLIAIASGALLIPGRQAPVAPPPPLPAPRIRPLVVVAADGLFLDEGERGATASGVRALLERGAVGWWPVRRAAPPELWTDVATGVSAERHGVRALARVRPAGSAAGLRPPAGTRWYLQGLAPRVGLVDSEPVSAEDRRSLTFWEVAASAGLSAGAIGWWASGPWPGVALLDNRELLRSAVGGLDVDARAIAAFERLGPQSVATVYLPGADILRDDPRCPDAVTRVGSFLADQVARAESGDAVLVVLAMDSHPPPGALGRIAVFDGIAPRSVRIRPEDVAPSLLARAGVPPARDLPGRSVPALFKAGGLETTTVATYGGRIAREASRSREVDREYLERLRSLGYLD